MYCELKKKKKSLVKNFNGKFLVENIALKPIAIYLSL